MHHCPSAPSLQYSQEEILARPPSGSRSHSEQLVTPLSSSELQLSPSSSCCSGEVRQRMGLLFISAFKTRGLYIGQQLSLHRLHGGDGPPPACCSRSCGFWNCCCPYQSLHVQNSCSLDPGVIPCCCCCSCLSKHLQKSPASGTGKGRPSHERL